MRGNSNYCYDIYRDQAGRWGGRVVSRFEAARKSFDTARRHPNSSGGFVMRIPKGDMMLAEKDGGEKIYRVVMFSEGKIILAEHHEANVSARAKDKDDAFGFLQVALTKLPGLKARMVGIDISAISMIQGSRTGMIGRVIGIASDGCSGVSEVDL